ncbi:DNA mismatch repair endonuclease MutL [Actinobacillus porcinus]|uniref:DNA mismatch repair endonuclease MutL n=1 Tax=Actinobacillus porcinus TaxID=51048 RepID=UPI002355F579|nr:DNA mismatch repair endonuclease MutL [Actinobacillus porcinus]MCI5763366.1 DNA mismatch repair endonuclease MutL [Actinobacillus porcinus]MDY5422174.1 DNA mismatch repair endonuclease MutL [Actinobacillus porcinus]
MPIQILPPQLANQIAAGEVVERPASVVKELVENSLDAGANIIRVDIENGGASLIRIRDNGSGIPKEELPLSLARHATSKISCMDDLEAILSFGFRGEALASISSVSRLTLTSRTAEQSEAWQVYVQGRDQESTIQPASHPVGTTVEVANLFFNTPARRKFLRTDKTEFAHIDEVIRRIALAKPNIAFTLTHNGKTVRQYKSAVNEQQKLKRVAAICGEDFVQHALQIDWKHDDLHLSGWVATADFTRSQNDLAYCYINGRMVKDKVINHAIRQAYAEHLSTEQYPAFVLFLDLNPNDVDVNVHPTKHEVRFQQSRLIHDFIFQGISNALLSAEQLDFSNTETATDEIQESPATYHYAPTIKPNRVAAGRNMFERAYSEPGYSSERTKTSYSDREQYWPKQPDFQPRFQSNAHAVLSRETPSKTEQRLYGELLQSHHQTEPVVMPVAEELSAKSMLRALALVNEKALLLQQDNQFYLLPLAQLQQVRLELALNPQSPKQPLLIPIVFRLDTVLQQKWQQQKDFFARLGFEFIENLGQQRITLNSVPQCLRQQNLQKIVMSLLHQDISENSAFLTALCQHVDLADIKVLAGAVNLLQEVERLLSQQQQLSLTSLLIPVNFDTYLSEK